MGGWAAKHLWGTGHEGREEQVGRKDLRTTPNHQPSVYVVGDDRDRESPNRLGPAGSVYLQPRPAFGLEAVSEIERSRWQR
jgi:hypothetical protein